MGWVSNCSSPGGRLVIHALGSRIIDDDEGLIGILVLVDTRNLVAIKHGIDEIVTYAQVIAKPPDLVVIGNAYIDPAARLDALDSRERTVNGL